MSLLNHHLTRRSLTVSAATLGTLVAVPGIAAAQDATPEATPATDGPLLIALPSGGTNPDGSWTFTDDRGQVVDLPTTPTKVIAWVGYAAALYDLGFEVVGITGTGAAEDGTPNPVAGRLPVTDIPDVDDGGEVDLEAIIQLGAELYIGTNYDLTASPPISWPLSADATTQVANIMPIVHIAMANGTDARREIQTITNLAEALGVDVTASTIAEQAAAFDTAISDLETILAERSGLTALFMSGYADAWWPSWDTPDINLYQNLGLQLVKDGVENPDGYSWEVFPEWACDLIFIDNRRPVWWSAEQLQTEIPTFSFHPAVEANQLADWNTTFVPSYLGFTPDVIAMTEAIRATTPDVVTD